MSEMRPSGDALDELREAMRRFTTEREWTPFHTPKNLAMALAGEAGELLEHFQWLTPEQSARLPWTPTKRWRWRWRTCCFTWSA